MKILFIAIFILSSLSLSGKEVALNEKLKKEIKQKKIEKLINEEVRMIQSIRRPNASILHRLIELYAEQITILYKKDNQRFLKLSHGNKKKSFYFKKSRTLYVKTHTLALKTLSHYKNYHRKDQIYYTIALLSRDFDSNKYTRRYLKKAEKLAKTEEIKHKVDLGLAEYYYNEKKFKTSIRYFKKVVKNQIDPWLSKHLFNLSWCYQMTKKHNLALSTMLNSFDVSNRKGYVNITQQVLSTLAHYYVDAKKTNEGIVFFNKNAEKPQEFLLKMAKKTAKKGEWKETKNLITEIDKNSTQKDENFNLFIEFKLTTFKQFKKYNLFYQFSKELMSLSKNIEPGQEQITFSKAVIELVEKRNQYLQSFLIHKEKNKYKQNLTKVAKIEKRIDSYFVILEIINPVKKCEYSFHRSENYYLLHRYSLASTFYKKSLTKCITSNNKKYIRKNINSMLATSQNLKGSESTDLKKIAYLQYISSWPKASYVKGYMEELFKIYSSEKDYSESKSLLIKYASTFPKSQKSSKKMINNLIDHSIKSKNTDEITSWLSYIKHNKISFSKKHVYKITEVLGELLFVELGKLKNIETSIAKHKEIFNDKKYPLEIKIKASLILSTLSQKSKNSKELLSWLAINHKLTTSKEYNKYKGQLFSMLSKSFINSNFNEYDQMIKIVSKRCSSFSKRNRETLVSYYFETLTAKHSKRKSLITPSLSKVEKACNVNKSFKRNLLQETFSFYKFSKNYNGIRDIWESLDSSTRDQYLNSLVSQYWENHILSYSNRILHNEINRFKKINKSKIISNFNNERKVFSSLGSIISKLNKKSFFLQTKKFNEKLFNKNLDSLLASLAEIGDEFNKDSKVLSSIPVMILTHKLSDVYKQKSRFMARVNTSKLEKNYRQGLEKAMRKISSEIMNQSKFYYNSGLVLAKKNREVYLWNNVLRDKTRTLNTSPFLVSRFILNDRG